MINPFSNHQCELQQLINDYQISFLALFGSRARGDHRPDSDYDLLIDFQKGNDQLFEVSEKISSLLDAKADIIPVSQLNRHVAPFALADLTIFHGQLPEILKDIIPSQSGQRAPITYVRLLLDDIERVKPILNDKETKSLKDDQMLQDALNLGFRRIERKGAKLKLHFPTSTEYLTLAEYLDLLSTSIPKSVSQNIPLDKLRQMINSLDQFETRCKEFVKD